MGLIEVLQFLQDTPGIWDEEAEMKVVINHGVIPGKKRCDLCGRSDVGPISEIQIPQGAKGKKGYVGKSFWFDACSLCGKRHSSGEGVLGPRGFVTGLAARLRGTGCAK
jgi:hypothetical protein